MSTPLAPPGTDDSVAAHLRDYVTKVRGGEIGSLAAVLGLVVLCVGFSVARPSFFTAGNFANLFTQGAPVMIIAMGLVFVLLLGEIDLSAGFASGVCAAILAVFLTEWGLPWYLGVGAALLTGVVIGLVLGTLVAYVGIPSFVVTLAAFLGFQGLLLLLLKGGRNTPVEDDVIYAIENRNLPVWLGWVLAVVAIAGYAAVQFARHRTRTARGLATEPLGIVAARIAGLAVILLLATAVLSRERSINIAVTSVKGVPVIAPIIGVLLVVFTFVLQRTPYGRHVYAVGGNKEAARRAGINVNRIRVSVFMVGSFMAAIGGIAAASRASSVDPNTGGSNVLLYAVGAAVIGGTSLFGGKGRVLDAVIGGAVIAVIDNGMGLMDFSGGAKFATTGLILLLAATVDALSRRRATATGNR
ncbi:sugar ABC transporter permease [Spirilliplanes yamanashiensis]|uniref:Xylose transport system permease protein XylH n=1 Tax=Spirilliplanes yamanashiensis TaxID=42233 RepID=A0A8J4DKD9_9ACTN|nr:ABC transporter permease [Spirilliplanes yamanashiensis]MDP9815942.1 D-xylose transport system permease protein [Spirilliplanes yamanashiensis]GIJ04198.1 ABC transporter permease [Spirilliplanes yamanashiensis]